MDETPQARLREAIRVKSLSVFLVISCFVAAGAAQAQEKSPGGMMMHHRVARGVRLEVRNDAAAQVLIVREGPLSLPAHTDHMAAAQPPNLFFTIPFDGWLVAYHPRMVDGRGQPVPGRLLHHVAFWNTARSDWLCPRYQEHIFGAGGELSDWPAVPGYGYRVHQGNRIRVNTMVNNPTENDYPDAYLELRIEYRRASPGGPQLKDVYPSWFDVVQCAEESAYDLPPGQSVKMGKIILRYSGVLLGVGGHLHDYGRRLVLTDLTRKQEIATLDAKLDPEGHLVSIPVVSFADRGGYRLDQGDVIEVSASYDNPTDKQLPEAAMGIVVGYFLPDQDAQLAALARKATRKR